MFGAELRDLQSEVGRVDHRLVNAVHLVAEDQRILLPAGEFRGESLKADRVHRLLAADHRVAVGPEPRDHVQRAVRMLPRHAVLRPEG